MKIIFHFDRKERKLLEAVCRRTWPKEFKRCEVSGSDLIKFLFETLEFGVRHRLRSAPPVSALVDSLAGASILIKDKEV